MKSIHTWEGHIAAIRQESLNEALAALRSFGVDVSREELERASHQAAGEHSDVSVLRCAARLFVALQRG